MAERICSRKKTNKQKKKPKQLWLVYHMVADFIPPGVRFFCFFASRHLDKLFVASVVRADQRDPLYFAFFGGKAESCSRLP